MKTQQTTRPTPRRVSRIADDEKPSDKLKQLARREAVALGHTLGWWTAKENGCWTARCVHCFRIASVIPALLTRDGRGFGGKALTEYCVNEEGNGA